MSLPTFVSARSILYGAIALLLAGLGAVSAWAVSARTRDRSTYEERIRAIGASLDTARRRFDEKANEADSLGRVVLNTTPQIITRFRDRRVPYPVLRVDRVPGPTPGASVLDTVVGVPRSELERAAGALETCQELALRCAELRARAEEERNIAQEQAATFRKALEAERRGRWVTRGFSVGVGMCYTLDGRILPCANVSYSVQVHLFGR